MDLGLGLLTADSHMFLEVNHGYREIYGRSFFVQDLIQCFSDDIFNDVNHDLDVFSKVSGTENE